MKTVQLKTEKNDQMKMNIKSVGRVSKKALAKLPYDLRCIIYRKTFIQMIGAGEFKTVLKLMRTTAFHLNRQVIYTLLENNEKWQAYLLELGFKRILPQMDILYDSLHIYTKSFILIKCTIEDDDDLYDMAYALCLKIDNEIDFIKDDPLLKMNLEKLKAKCK